MIKFVNQLLLEEDSRLAMYAVKNADSMERLFSEDSHDFRLPLQRDRDRIYHSRYFKRLQYKTQVFTNTEGDNFRTRLTHTLEVSGIARGVSLSLGLNSTLAECIALAHDLGHAPFGHAGQDILSELMKDHGGFEHNKQSLRIVQVLEKRYFSFDGLNLTKVTLLGIMKHSGNYSDSPLNEIRREEGPSLESQITDKADEIAYTCHDIEDGLEMGFIQIEDLMDSNLWKEEYQRNKEKFKTANQDTLIRSTTRSILNFMVIDLTKNISENLITHKVLSREDSKNLWKQNIHLVNYSDKIGKEFYSLKKLLHEKLYKHPKVVSMSKKGQERIEKLFTYYSKHFDKIPESFKNKLETEDKSRTLCDYISGMTDRFAILQSDSLF
jgi:dGTPase